MTTERTTAALPAAALPPPRGHADGPPRLAPGTRISMVTTEGRVRFGRVQHYEPENTLGSSAFPVRFDGDPRWRMLSSDYLTVVTDPEGGDGR